MEIKDSAKLHIVNVQGWVRKDGKFLMAQRSLKELQAPGLWSIPGGKIENVGEVQERVLEKQLKQEILEEVGVVVKDQMKFMYDDFFIRVDGASVVAITFICDWESGEAKALEDTEQVNWFTLDELVNFAEAPDFLKRQIKELEKFLNLE